MAPGGVIHRPTDGRFYRQRFGIRFVFITFAVIALIGGLITWLFAIETKGKSLEELSP
jgi:hypothetical protein